VADALAEQVACALVAAVRRGDMALALCSGASECTQAFNHPAGRAGGDLSAGDDGVPYGQRLSAASPGVRLRAERARAWRRYVVAKPDVRAEELGAGDDIVILASDGLWDVLTNEDACALVKDMPVRGPRTDAACVLVEGRPVRGLCGVGAGGATTAAAAARPCLLM